jgi:23S rRNA pseudouridine955/2504/2580 synthase/23S rRNA pseudouridine1911/1915/1917 synthase
MSSIKKYIVYQDADLVSLNKPSGILSVPDRFDEQLPSLKRMLKEELGEIFVIHRLDRDTSGLILFAKNAEAHRYYSGIFEDRKVEKTYLGLVHGVPQQAGGTIDKPIAPHFTVKGKMMVYRKGKNAITHYRTLETFGLYSLMEFRIETGRTHQIRVHMQDMGHPIVCDVLYGTDEPVLLSRIKRNYKLSKQELEERPLLNRLALHSWKLSFTDRLGKELSLEAELPKDMTAVLQQLRKVKLHPTK